MVELDIKQGEGRWLRFTLTGTFPSALADATIEFGAKLRESDEDYALNYGDEEVDKSLASSGIVRVHILPADSLLLTANRKYYAELEVDFGNNNVYKTPTFILDVKYGVVKEVPEA